MGDEGRGAVPSPRDPAFCARLPAGSAPGPLESRGGRQPLPASHTGTLTAIDVPLALPSPAPDASAGATGQPLWWAASRVSTCGNGVYRLLDAACDGGHVTGVDAEDSRRMAEVEAMMALSRDQRWALLVDRELGLLDNIEREVRAGVLRPCKPLITASVSGQVGRWSGQTGRRGPPPGACDAPYRRGRQPGLRTTANHRLQLHRRVARVVGPDSSQRDLLLGSGRARGAAEDYLLHCDESAPNP